MEEKQLKDLESYAIQMEDSMLKSTLMALLSAIYTGEILAANNALLEISNRAILNHKSKIN